jgi:hypothetical protein
LSSGIGLRTVTTESEAVDICLDIITEIQVFNRKSLLSVHSLALEGVRTDRYH